MEQKHKNVKTHTYLELISWFLLSMPFAKKQSVEILILQFQNDPNYIGT